MSLNSEVIQLDLNAALVELNRSINVCRALKLLVSAADLEMVGESKAAETFREYAWATLTADEASVLRQRLNKRESKFSFSKTYVADPKLL